uniref:Uncharacterized protein n=1 Tax=Anguilla anguilla TaxID=7936 RepID=A0A0E9TBM3_ANGAN
MTPSIARQVLATRRLVYYNMQSENCFNAGCLGTV